VDTGIELRCYSDKPSPGAYQDAKGWYTAINFLPSEGAALPICDSVVVLRRVALDRTYIDSWFTQANKQSKEVSITYDGSILMLECAEYGDLLLAYFTFLRDSLAGFPISLLSSPA
jgi:hypothetical protein